MNVGDGETHHQWFLVQLTTRSSLVQVWRPVLLWHRTIRHRPLANRRRLSRYRGNRNQLCLLAGNYPANLTVTGDSINNLDFYIYTPPPPPYSDLFVISMTSAHRPGFNAFTQFKVRNAGNQVMSGFTLTATVAGSMFHLSESPAASTVVSSNQTCNLADTLTRTITVLSNSTRSIAEVEACAGEAIQIGIPPYTEPNITYLWEPELFLSNPNLPNPFFLGEDNQDYTLLVSNGVCTDTIFQSVEVTSVDLFVPDDLIVPDVLNGREN